MNRRLPAGRSSPRSRSRSRSPGSPPARMSSTKLSPTLCETTGGGKFVSIPGFPGEMIDRRLLADIRWLRKRYQIFITDGYSMDDVHASNGEHPLGLALDIVPDKAAGGTLERHRPPGGLGRAEAEPAPRPVPLGRLRRRRQPRPRPPPAPLLGPLRGPARTTGEAGRHGPLPGPDRWPGHAADAARAARGADRARGADPARDRRLLPRRSRRHRRRRQRLGRHRRQARPRAGGPETDGVGL